MRDWPTDTLDPRESMKVSLPDSWQSVLTQIVGGPWSEELPTNLSPSCRDGRTSSASLLALLAGSISMLVVDAGCDRS
jgi:hypothetical protein